MTHTRQDMCRIGERLVAVVGLAVALGLGAHPALAQQIGCDEKLDSDGDGFSDFQECNGIILNDGALIPACVSTPDGTADTDCLQPGGKDLFAVLAPAGTGSLLSQIPNPYDPNPLGLAPNYGIKFQGLAGLGVSVRPLGPGQVTQERIVTSASPQRAVKVSESLDTSGTILGNCQWGTPNGLDGCVVYTARAQKFIASTCGTLPVVQPNGAPSNVLSVVRAYTNYLVLHETAHSLGGLTGQYNSRTGGYHYKPGAGFVMEQAVTYSTKGGTCKFYISPNWNTTLDVPAVKIK